MGLYGQNGSGKTALIDALTLLKIILTGSKMPDVFSDYINVDSDCAKMKYNFKVINNSANFEYDVHYEFDMRKEVEAIQDPLLQINGKTEEKQKTVIFNEVLSYSYKDSNVKLKKSPIVDTRTNEVFSPNSKYTTLVGNSEKTRINLLSYKRLAEITSKSFVFSNDLLNAIRQNCSEMYLMSLLGYER